MIRKRRGGPESVGSVSVYENADKGDCPTGEAIRTWYLYIVARTSAESFISSADGTNVDEATAFAASVERIVRFVLCGNGNAVSSFLSHTSMGFDHPISVIPEADSTKRPDERYREARVGKHPPNAYGYGRDTEITA
jgi:hypothetical protein